METAKFAEFGLAWGLREGQGGKNGGWMMEEAMYTVSSVKTSDTQYPTLRDAARAALRIDAEYQSAYGVQVEGPSGRSLSTDDPSDLLRLHLAAARE